MVKKAGIIILVLIVLVTGYISFRKLNYWDRSVMIFKYDSSVQSFRGRGGRGFGEFEGREGVARRPEFREGMPRPGARTSRDRDFSGRGDFGGGGRGGRGFNGRGNNVNLNMVLYYLGVFALFTLIMIYLEKGYRLIFKQKKLTKENSDLII